ncbi:hypothetical protein [Enterococcus sp. DIV0660C]|uniref:hypothetical protein n=1 Tax=Enterococcus sp. DIV0660C TaxID=2230880 RepID=UPI001F5C6C37|nr:hypothetical protein [Enterococcus sp. DIV0660C]
MIIRGGVGKKHLAIYKIAYLEVIEPLKYHHENNMNDWVITDSIDEIKASVN